MSCKEENMISIPLKWIIIGFAFFVILFIIGNRIVDKRAKSVDYLQFQDALDTTYVENPVNDRGWLFYDDNYQRAVNSNSVLVENRDGYDGWNITISSDPTKHYLWFLPGPFYMFKAAYNDTIAVIKDGYILKFKMPNNEHLKNTK